MSSAGAAAAGRRIAEAQSSPLSSSLSSPARQQLQQQQQEYLSSSSSAAVTSSAGFGRTTATPGGVTNATSTSSSSLLTYASSPSSQRRTATAVSAAAPSVRQLSPDCSRHPDDDDDCLGFASLPEQVHRKAVKRGFDFTVMVVGESGLGKSTLLSCLFLNNDLYANRVLPTAEERITKTVEIEKKYMEIEEKGVKLRLTVVDTPGFNDSLNASQCWIPIRDYIDSQFDQFFKDETGLNRKNIKDNRVHCCLYFISPYGHGLRQIDIELMQCLQERVNIVPVIAKSDMLTPAEIRRLKTRILEEIARNKIRIYEFPECDNDEDEDFKRQDAELKAAIPFAVMGSSTVVDINGKKVRGRLYPWGIVEVDNPSHSDFSKLRQFIISTHMQDLKDVTRDVHYENFRANHIQEQLVSTQKERNKLKRESGANFEVNFDTEKLLQQKEREIQQMKEMLKAMHAQLASNKQNGQQAVINGVRN
jgi:septin 4